MLYARIDTQTKSIVNYEDKEDVLFPVEPKKNVFLPVVEDTKPVYDSKYSHLIYTDVVPEVIEDGAVVVREWTVIDHPYYTRRLKDFEDSMAEEGKSVLLGLINCIDVLQEEIATLRDKVAELSDSHQQVEALPTNKAWNGWKVKFDKTKTGHPKDAE